MLPRLKYYNPAVPMIVNRKDNNEGAAVMSIYYQNATSTSDAAASRVQPPSSGIDSSKAVAPAADERVVKIPMKNKHSDDILAAFLAETRAEPVTPTPEEIEELRAAEEFSRQGAKDRIMVKTRLDAIRKEEEMLKAARESASTS